MAKVHGDRLLDLESLTATLISRLDAFRREVDNCIGTQGKASDSHGELLVSFTQVKQIVVDVKDWKDQCGLDSMKTEHALLKKEIEDLKSKIEELKAKREETSKWRWTFVPIIVSVVATAVCTCGIQLLIWYLNKK